MKWLDIVRYAFRPCIIAYMWEKVKEEERKNEKKEEGRKIRR
jgi:hypothetical protein